MSTISRLLARAVAAGARFIPDKAPDPLRDAHTYLGKPLNRVDGRPKVTGQARFSAEFRPKNLAYASVVTSTIAKGRIRHIDTAAAQQAAGVLGVITNENAPTMKPPPAVPPFSSGEQVKGTAATDLPVLGNAMIYWNGQPVAVVVAETLEQAEYAASLVHVEYDVQPARLSFHVLKHEATKPYDVLVDPPHLEIGHAEAQLAHSAVAVDHVYRTPRHNHNAMEPHAAIAVWDEHGGLTLYDSTQYVYGVRDTLAAVFSLDPGKVRVIVHYVGGSFGGKGNVWDNTILCAAAARAVGRPVQLALSREAVFRLVGGRAPTEQRVALGADPNGRLHAIIHTALNPSVEHGPQADAITASTRHSYTAEHILIDQRIVSLDMVANTPMRGPGPAVGSFALESAIDELAYELRVDPLELRRINEPTKDPTSGHSFSSRHFIEACDRGAEQFGWRQRPPCSQRDGQWVIGQGVAAALYHVVRFPAVVRVRINADGTALVQTSAQDNGMGTATVQIQHAAERLGLPIENVRFEYGDTNLPKSAPAGASNQTVALVQATRDASEKVQREILSLAGNGSDGPLAGVAFDHLQARDGGLFRTDDRRQGESYGAILKRHGRAWIEAQAESGLPFETMKYSMHSYGMHFCELRVHEQTGEVRISRWLGSFDCGRILNAKTASSQFRGGIIMGIGAALMEETLFDERSGRIVNPSLAEYHVPVHLDVPHIDIIYTDIPDDHTAVGAHGIGEIGITGVSAAIANAVFNATGKRIRELPITLDKLLDDPASSAVTAKNQAS
jgi:xanthine dehydrogenase YagR molybdenum-binding subunit